MIKSSYTKLNNKDLHEAKRIAQIGNEIALKEIISLH